MSDLFNRSNDINPIHSGLYIVDRGEKLGTAFRWFDVDTSAWSRCEYIMEDAINAKGATSSLGWLPWRGPIKVAKAKPVVEPVEYVKPTVVGDNTKPAVTAKPAKAVKVAKPKVAKAPRAGKAVHPDGSIVYRADRNKYMAWYGGKSEAARPTIEAAKAFLTKKYGITEFTVIQ